MKNNYEVSVSTLDASNASYYFEKVRVENTELDPVKHKTEFLDLVDQERPIHSNLEYLASFYDKSTGTSSVAFKEMDTDKTIIAYTGTNLNFGDGGWKKVLDKNWWLEFFQKDVMKSDLAGIGFGTG